MRQLEVCIGRKENRAKKLVQKDIEEASAKSKGKKSETNQIVPKLIAKMM